MSVVLITRADQAAALRKRLGGDPTSALYADCESLRALDAILARPPRIVALDRGFASTARGAALVARLKSASHLQGTDVRVLAEDEMSLPLLLNAKNPGHEAEVVRASHPLDCWGTRRAPRFSVASGVDIIVNGERGRLVNLSATGAQMLAPLRVRPDEPLRVALVDSAFEVRTRAVVAWSAAEPVNGQLRYRAGLDFVDADSMVLETFCVRHFAAPDRACPVR